MKAPCLKSLTTLFLLGAGTLAGAAENRHVLPPDKGIFQYLVHVETGKEVYVLHRRFSVLGRNVDGDFIVSAVDVNPAKKDTKYIEDIQYVLGKDDCILHFFTGTTFRTAGDCGRALPSRSWDVMARKHGGAGHCKIPRARPEQVNVAAGTFEAIRIDCRTQIPGMPEPVKASYWYAPSLGAMVKSASRVMAPNGKPARFTEELEEYKLP
jgi:hypothetical protein